MVPKDSRAILFVMLGAFALCALLTKSHVTSWNDASRFATIDSLANRGTFAIEGSPFARETFDDYRYGGHVYSDKPPALAVLGSGVAVILKAAGITIANKRTLWVYFITLFVIGSSFALGCGYAFAFARELGYSPRLSAFTAVLAGVATLNLPYATVFTNHVPCGAALIGGLYHLYRLRDGTVHAIAAGLLLSLACLFDAAAGIVTIAAVVLLFGAPRARILTFVCACIPFIALQLAYSWHSSGAVIPPGLNAHFWSDPQSTFGKTSSLALRIRARDYLSYIAFVTIGGKGVFLYTPLTLVCAFGFVRLWQSGKAQARRLALAVVGASVLLFALIVLFTGDTTAANYGERRFVDIFFILCIGLTPAIASLRGRAASFAALAAVIASLIMAALGTVNPFAGGTAPGYIQAAAEFQRLALRSPLQAALDVAALVTLIGFVVRFWPKLGRTLQA